MKCDRIVCCGDVVGYGAQPAEAAIALREAEATVVLKSIRGNHDRWAIEEPESHSAVTIDYLSSLPKSLGFEVDGLRVAVRHGSPLSDMDTIYPDQEDVDDLKGDLALAEADILIVGHVHMPYEIRGKAGMIVNPGPVLRRPKHRDDAWVWSHLKREMVPLPQDGAGGTFGVLDLPERKFAVFRVEDGTEVEILRKEIP